MSTPNQASHSNGLPPRSHGTTFNRAGALPERMAPSFHFTTVPPEVIARLKSSWILLKKSEGVRQMLVSFLETSENPYAVALQIISECEDLFHNKANTLAAFVVEEFCTWAKHREEQIQHNLTPQLKHDAFCLITMQRNSSLIKSIMVTFKMEEDKTLFLEHIRDFISTKRYKEACQCAVALNLINQFPIDQIIFPLILQDKLSIAEEALSTDPELQLQLVSRLDQIVAERSLRNYVGHIVNQLEVPDVKLDRFLNHKSLGKLITKLVKMFNLPSDATPNLNLKRSAGALNFIFGKRFFDKSLSIDSWKEMAYDAVKDSETLQFELVAMLCNYNEVEEALYWALEFSVPQHKWPYNVSMHFKRDPLAKYEFPRPNASNDQEPEDWSDGNDYHSLALSDSAILMVDSEELLKDCFLYIKNHDCPIVGIDSEWKPAFGTRQNELSLIQLATWDRIFILDVIGMSGLSPDVWHEAAQLFFENPKVLKLGFSLATDMVMIKTAIAPLANIKMTGSGYLDLSSLWRCLQNKGLTFPFSDASQSSGESLSRLVSLCFGRSLNKSDQFSNWEQRPLRVGQKRYAALDAFCLLELHRDMQKLAEEQGLPFLEVCDEIIMGFRSPKKNHVPAGFGRGRGRGWRPPGASAGPGPSRGQEGESSALQDVSSFKFVADLMLCGLGRQLRKCGVDCLILERAVRRQPHAEVYTLLQDILNHQKIVLSQGSNVQWFKDRLPHDSVYHVQSAAASNQLDEVLRHFKITIQEEDVFTRCQLCNSHVFDVVSQEGMLGLRGLGDSLLAMESGCANAAAVDLSAMTGNFQKQRNFVLTEDSAAVKKGVTHLGVRINAEEVPDEIFRRVEYFYVCSTCGKVYWDETI